MKIHFICLKSMPNLTPMFNSSRGMVLRSTLSEGISLLSVTLYLGAQSEVPLGLLSMQSFKGFVQGRKGIFEKSSFSSEKMISMNDRYARNLLCSEKKWMSRPSARDRRHGGLASYLRNCWDTCKYPMV